MLWLVFLRSSNVDMGFLRKGKPFLTFDGSRATCRLEGRAGSDAIRPPGGRFPPGGAL